MKSAAAQLNGLLAKFTPQVARAAKEALARTRKRWPGAIELEGRIVIKSVSAKQRRRRPRED